MKKILLTLIALLSIASLLRCSSSGDSGIPDNFDRTAMLTNWADNIIIPSYSNYYDRVFTLENDILAFSTTPTETNLQTVRASWVEAYKSYQKISLFYIGPAADISLNERANTYPADVTGIEANITSGSYNLDQFSQYPRQGFPGLDYLINGMASTDAAIVAIYTNPSDANKHIQYLANVVSKLKLNALEVLSGWNTNGYRDTFIAGTGTGVSSSVSKMTNLFVKNLEKTIRTGKIGIPAGLFSSGTTFPDKVEAYYKNDISKELLNISIQAEKDFFNGKYANSATTGPSLKSYLDYLNAVRNGQNLGTIINNQFDAIFTSNAALSNSFSQQVNTDNTKMVTAYNVIQQEVIYIKLDMMQALNISIDYVDGDGD